MLLNLCDRLPLQVIELELSTGIPMLYMFKDGKFQRRGSPLSRDAAGVFALTPVSALPHAPSLSAAVRRAAVSLAVML